MRSPIMIRRYALNPTMRRPRHRRQPRQCRRRDGGAVELAGVSGSATVVCDACGKARAPFDLGPMLHDHIWQQIAAPGERMLCDMCMYDRAFEWLGRTLALADLQPCSFNLFHRPDSWFDVFSHWEEGPPQNLAEWQAMRSTLGEVRGQ